jgi:hypothetical protein
MLACLPVLSFTLQLAFSSQAGTIGTFMRHPTVMFVDWVFVPFNFLVASIIDWRRGRALYLITAISVALNVLTHAYWQQYRLDPGHMITQAGVVLPAGWVHLAFSTLEMTLLVAFIFCRRSEAPRVTAAKYLVIVYFVLMAVVGYFIQGRLIAGDVIAWVSGLLLVLVFPRRTGQAA